MKMTNKEIKDMLRDAIITTKTFKRMIDDGQKTKSIKVKGLLGLSTRAESICREILKLRKQAKK